MIGAAGAPMAKAVAPAPPHAPARVDAPAADAQPAPPHGPGSQRAGHPAHPAERDRARGARREPRPADGDRPGEAHARGGGTRHAARATHRPREDRETEATPHEDAFARLLTPDAADATHAAEHAPSAPHPSAARDADGGAGALPDQLLGLLASLAPGATAGNGPDAARADAPAAGLPAQAAAPAAGDASAATPLQAALATPAATPGAAAAAARSDAVAAHGHDASVPLPAGQDKDAGMAATGATTRTGTAALPATAPHAGGATDAPATPAFDALLQATAAAPAPAVPGGHGPVASAPAPLAQPADPRNGYSDDFGGNLVWMAEQRLGHARLHVSPEHLGPIEVRLQLDGTQVQASFASAQADVRQALEASLPRLRELLGQHGLQLAQADVGQRQQDPRPPHARADAAGREPGDDATVPASPVHARRVRGLLDEYA